MVKVLLYGEARLNFKEKELSIEANSIKDMLKAMAVKFNVSYKSLKNYLIYVNDVNMTSLHMFRTKLNDGDIIMMLSPSSGG